MTYKKAQKLPILLLTLTLLIAGYFFLWPETKEASATWWNDSWLYRKAITINSDQVAADLTDFPMLVSLTDSGLATNAQEDGDDIVFTDSKGEKLSHEIESYASSTGALVAWVKIPSLSSTEDQTIYMYYGNASVSSQEDGENVWDNDFKMVQHLEEDGTGTRYDSTSYDNDGTTNNFDGNEATTTAKINGGDDFDGATWESLSASHQDYFSNAPFTASLWFKHDSPSSASAGGMINKYHPSTPWSSWSISIQQPSQKIYFTLYDPSYFDIASDSIVATSTWYNVSVTFDESYNMKMYVNGVLQADEETSGGLFDATGTLNFPVNNFDGTIDEVRFSSTDRSSTWIQTEYNNQNDPTAFITPQTEEVGPGPVAYWSFDEGYGSTAHDESGQGNDGTIVGAVWKNESECVSGKCLFFDGNDYVQTITTNILSNQVNVTMDAWFKLATSTATGPFNIIDQQGKDTITVIDDKLAGKCDGGSNDVYSTNSVNDGKWHHVAISGDEGGGTILYVDGMEVDSVGDGSSNSGDDYTTIGANYGAYSNFFHGFIDEVKVYPYIRTADQIKQDYNAGLAGQSTTKGTLATFGSASEKWLSDGLAGHWKFDESATSSGAIDSSGNGNDGIYYGNASTTVGKYGRASVFAGDTDSIAIPTSPSIDLEQSGQISVSAWLKLSSLSNDWAIIHTVNHTQTSIGQFQYMLGLDSSNHLSFFVGNGNSSGYSQAYGEVPQTDRWYYLTGIADEHKVYLYIDGEFVDSVPLTTTPLDMEGGFSPNLRISNPSDNSWKGSIDEVRIYNRALSPSEVQKLYNWAPGPVVHIKMDEKEGDTAYDSSGNQYNGLLGNGEVWRTPLWTRGKYGAGLLYDGDGDYIPLGETMPLEAYTKTAWVKRAEGANMNNIISGNNGHALWAPNSWSGICSFCLAAGNASNFNTVVDTEPLEVDKWHFVAVSYDPGVNSGEMKLYKDGILVDSATGIARNTDATLQIGSWAANYVFKGTIDDVKVYDYARTQKQILEDMHLGDPLKGAVLDLSFDEGKGATAYDSSGHENNGSLQPGISGTTASSSMWSMDGVNGGAIEFDGVDDKVLVPTSDSLETIDYDFSVSAWFKSTSSGHIISTYEGFSTGYFSLDLESTGQIRAQIADISQTNNYSAKSGYNDGNWHHVVLMRDTTKLLSSLYLDGELQDTWEATSTEFITFQKVEVKVGYYNAQVLDGLVDEVKIYPFALNTNEIKKLYNDNKSATLGSTGTASDGSTTSNAKNREYCIPGDTSTCNPPVLELKLDEKSGATTYDTSGNGNDGAISGSAWTRGKYGSGLEMTADGDHILISDTNNSLDMTTTVTMSVWFYPYTLESGWHIIAGKGSSVQNYALWTNSNKFVAVFNDGSWRNHYTISTYTPDQWYHLAMVVDNDNDYVRIYVNGVDDTQEPSETNTMVINDGDFKIAPTYVPNHINGIIDELKVFDYARTPAQIAYDYNGGKPIAHWSFNECSGSTIHDESGNGEHATLNLGSSGVTEVGTCAESSSSFWYNGRDGKNNNSGSFDGTDDIVTLPTDMYIYDARPFTISAWTYLDGYGLAGASANPTIIQLKSDDMTNGFLLMYSSNSSYKGIVFGDSDIVRGKTVGDISASLVGSWKHVVLTYNGQGFTSLSNYKLFLDGEEQAIESSGSLGTNFVNYIGRNWHSSSFFDGKIDDIKLYNYALTPEQIKTEYNGGAIRFGN